MIADLLTEKQFRFLVEDSSAEAFINEFNSPMTDIQLRFSARLLIAIKLKKPNVITDALKIDTKELSELHDRMLFLKNK